MLEALASVELAIGIYRAVNCLISTTLSIVLETEEIHEVISEEGKGEEEEEASTSSDCYSINLQTLKQKLSVCVPLFFLTRLTSHMNSSM